MIALGAGMPCSIVMLSLELGAAAAITQLLRHFTYVLLLYQLILLSE
jgi:hypothetical protein